MITAARLGTQHFSPVPSDGRYFRTYTLVARFHPYQDIYSRDKLLQCYRQNSVMPKLTSSFSNICKDVYSAK